MINKYRDILNNFNLERIYAKNHQDLELNKFFKLIFKKFSNSVILEDDEGNLLKYSNILEILSDEIQLAINRKLIFCFCDNDIYSIAGYFSFLAANAVPMMIKLDSSKEQINNLIKEYSPSYIWLNKKEVSIFTEYKEATSYGNYVLLATNYESYSMNPSLALLIGTSGSTGNSKYVKLSYKNIISNAFSISEYLNLNYSDKPITTLKPSYTYSLSILHSHILKGASIAITNKTMFEKTFWSFFEDIHATSISGVPFHYEMMRKLKFHLFKLRHLKTMTQAGGRIDINTAEYFRDICYKKKIDFYIMYGQSEGTARLSYLDPKYIFSKLGSIGKPIPGGNFWLEDENKNRIDRNNVNGELVYSGPNVSMGYANNKYDLNKNDSNNFLLRTGDIAYRDDEDFFFIVGRKKRFIKLFGHRINLVDLEIWLEKKSLNAICKGEDDLLEIFIKEPITNTLEKIFDEFTLEFKIPKHSLNIFSVQEFPISESGKVIYSKLEKSNAKKIR